MDSFNLEETSIWNFEDRGDWATHKGDYPGNCSPKVIRNLLLRYTKENDMVLDQFIGSGTTAIECLLLKRKITGFDINKNAIDITLNRIKDFDGEKYISIGDARKLNLNNESIDFICMHPPYWNIIQYSKSIQGDLSLMKRADYMEAIYRVAKESYRVLKYKKKCSVVIGDIRKNGYIQPLGFEVMKIFLDRGFLLKEIIVKEQHNCRSTDKWKEIAQKRNFLLIQHEYVFVFEKG